MCRETRDPLYKVVGHVPESVGPVYTENRQSQICTEVLFLANSPNANIDPATDDHYRRGEQAKAHRGICRACKQQDGADQYRQNAQPRRLGGTRQTPEFDEYTVVLAGTLRVESKSGAIDVHAGQAIITHAGEWVRYSTPNESGAEYIAVCLPAFSPDTVHRDE